MVSEKKKLEVLEEESHVDDVRNEMKKENGIITLPSIKNSSSHNQRQRKRKRKRKDNVNSSSVLNNFSDEDDDDDDDDLIRKDVNGKINGKDQDGDGSIHFASTLQSLLGVSSQESGQDEDEDEGEDEEEDDDDDNNGSERDLVENEEDDDEENEYSDDSQSSANGSVDKVVLSKRKTPLMKQLEKEKKEKVKLKQRTKAKFKFDFACVEIPSARSLNQERQLRKVATKGVVALFNAMRSAQSVAHPSSMNESKKTKTQSEEIFLKTLKDGLHGNGSDGFTDHGTKKENSLSAFPEISKGNRDPSLETSKTKKKSSWSVIQDDFLLHSNKLKSFDDGQDDDSDGNDNIEQLSMDEDSD